MTNVNKKMYELGNEGSAIRELFEYGKKRKLEIGDDNVFDFSIGNPSAKVPEKLTKTLKELLDNEDIHSYTSNVGDNKTRENIAKYLSSTYNTYIDKNLIYMTCGASASLFLAFNALVESEDDEIILFAPFFPEYRVFIEKTGAKVVVVDPDYDHFEINFDDLDRKINKNTKAVVINFPNNPTGAIITNKTLEKLSNYLKDKEKQYNKVIYLISDEPYREIIYDGNVCPFVTNYYDDSIVCYSYSKALSLAGERIGYTLVNPKAKEAENVFKAICGAGRSLGFVCAPSLFQKAVGLNQGLLCNINEYKENRDILVNNLTKLGYEFVYPKGAFYLFVKAFENDDIAFSKKAMKHELLLVPSSSFGIKGYVRVSYCVKKEVIINSYDAFKKLKEEYK